MRSKRGAVILMLVALVNLGFADSGSWQKSSGGILEPQINSIQPDPNDSNTVYAGTDKALYLSEDQGRTFRAILQIQGSDKSINDVYRPQWGKDLYVATGSGVYATDNTGLSWKNIFSPSEGRARQCFAVFSEDDVVYVGTLAGLYYKGASDSTWHRESGDLGNEPVYEITADEQNLYFTGDRRIYRKRKANDRGSEIKVIFDAGLIGENEGEEFSETEEHLLPQRHIKDFTAVKGFLFVGNDGVSYSSDEGQTWHSLPIVGLTPTAAIQALSIHQSLDFSHGNASFGAVESGLEGGFSIYAGTTQGVFRFEGKNQGNRWVPLYKGMETSLITDLAHDAGGKTLYAATSHGIFFLTKEKALASMNAAAAINFSDIYQRFEHEPSIQEVQRFAIHYAEVHPDKIKQWRTGAKYRAFLPTLSAGVDRDATERFHWDTGGNPDKLLEGRDFVDWDFSVSWDLADLIWNPDQTSIDSRSKLMVELREDIMDQITRLYFERRRVQVETVAAEASDLPVDPQLQFDRQMRVAELTALIDALTDGEFSEKIEKASTEQQIQTGW
jgi:hypothetical protein